MQLPAPTSIFAASTACSMYFTQNGIEQEWRDGERQLFVGLLGVDVLANLTRFWANFYKENPLINRALTVLGFAELGVLALFSVAEKQGGGSYLKSGFNQIPYLVKTAVVVSGIAFCVLQQPLAGALLLGTEAAHLLQQYQMLPLAVHRAINFIGIPLLILGMLNNPMQARIDRLWFAFDAYALIDRSNKFLHSIGRGFSFANQSLPTLNEVQLEKIQAFAEAFKTKVTTNEYYRGMNKEFYIDSCRYAFRFDPTSVHRLPSLLEHELKDGLEKATPQELVNRVCERAKTNNHVLTEGFERIRKAFVEQKFPDVVPVRADLLQEYIHLTMRVLLQKEDADFVSTLREIECIGLKCVDGWVGELNEQLPGNQGDLLSQIHANFGEQRSRWLDKIIEHQAKAVGKMFGINYGGANNVHYNQLLHLAMRPTFRTKTGEIALATSANQVDTLNFICTYILKKTLECSIQKNFGQLGTYHWIAAVNQLFCPEQIGVDEGQPKPWYPISPQAFWSWIAEKGEFYGFVDEDGIPNEKFFKQGTYKGMQKIELTEAGKCILLADAGILSLKIKTLV